MQKKNSRTEKGRPSACYTEAIWREGGKTTFTVSLGFLNEAERDDALARLRAWGERLLAVVPEDGMLRPLAEEGIAGNPFPAPGPAIPGTRVLTKEEIRQVALHDHGEGGVAELMARRHRPVHRTARTCPGPVRTAGHGPQPVPLPAIERVHRRFKHVPAHEGRGLRLPRSRGDLADGVRLDPQV